MHIDFDLYTVFFKDGVKMSCVLVPQEEGGYCFFAIDVWAFGAREYYETMDKFFEAYRNDPEVERLIKIA